MSDKKIIFLDVDGTLIDYEAKMPASAGKAVDQARANGHLVYICTGCSKAEVLERNLCELDGMIGANGGYVEDHGKVILHQSIPVDDVRTIVEWCDARGLGAVLETNEGIFYSTLMKDQARTVYSKYAAGKGSTFEDAWKKNEHITDQMIFLEGEDRYRTDINKIDFVLSSSQDFLDAKEAFPHMIANTWGGKDEQALFGDLSPAGITKANAIAMLLKHLGRDVEDTIAFGDAKIDISMFELCNYAVAMGNAGAETKEAADYITTDVNEDGIWNAFKHLGLI